MANLLHEIHASERPLQSAGSTHKEVLREQGANHAAEISIERDQTGRIVKKTTRELQRSSRDVFGEGGYRLEDLSPDKQQTTVERFEYDDAGRLVRSVEEKFNPFLPESAYFTTTVEYAYADNGQLETKHIEFSGFNSTEPLTYSSQVTKWEGDKPMEFIIDDNRSKEQPKRIRRVRTYAFDGRISSEIDFALGDGDQQTETDAYLMAYDDAGRIIEVSVRRPGGKSVWKYEYVEVPEGRMTTRRSFDSAGREGTGERVTLGPNGEKLRYESWFFPDKKFGDTSWKTQ